MTRRRFARMRCRRMMFPASIRIKSNRMQLAALLDCSLGSIAAARSSFFFVLIRLLSKPLTPDLLSRLQALSPDLLLRGALASGDPCNSELCFFMAVLNYDLVSNLHLASITTQLHTMVADIESMREMSILTPGLPAIQSRTGTTDLVLFDRRLPVRNRGMFHAHSEYPHPTCPPGESRTECATASVPVGFAKAFQIAAARSLCACKEPAIRRSPKRIATPTTCPTTSASCGCLRMRAGTGDHGCGCSTMQSRLIWHQQHVKPSRVSTK